MKEVIQVTLGEKIKEARKQAGLSQEQLSEKLGVSRSAVAKWETNGGIPDRDNLYRLAEVLNVTVNDLHHIIEQSKLSQVDLEANITADVIAALESYGYQVIRPGKKEINS